MPTDVDPCNQYACSIDCDGPTVPGSNETCGWSRLHDICSTGHVTTAEERAARYESAPGGCPALTTSADDGSGGSTNTTAFVVIAVAIIAVTACMFTLLKRHRGPPSPLGHADADAVIADGLALSPVVDMIVNPMRERANRGIELTNMPPQQPTLDVDINNAAGDEYQLYERACAEVTAAAANDDDTEYELPQRRSAQEPTTDNDTYEVAVTNNPQHYTRSAVVPPTAGPVPQIYQLPTGAPTSPPLFWCLGPLCPLHSYAQRGCHRQRRRSPPALRRPGRGVCSVPGCAHAAGSRRGPTRPRVTSPACAAAAAAAAPARRRGLRGPGRP